MQDSNILMSLTGKFQRTQQAFIWIKSANGCFSCTIRIGLSFILFSRLLLRRLKNIATLSQAAQNRKQGIKFDRLSQIRSRYCRQLGRKHSHRYFRISFLRLFPSFYTYRSIGINQYQIRFFIRIRGNDDVIRRIVHFKCHTEYRLLLLTHLL